jgi:AcrR family transcriptional regulator
VERAATPKRSETRSHILAAAVATIDESGVAGASAAAIARRSGLSWGVIQYHFGSHPALLQATFDHSIDQFVERLGTWSGDGTVAERGAALIGELWEQMAQPTYRASLELQLHLARQAAPEAYRAGARRASTAIRRTWRRTFPDVDVRRIDDAHDLVMPALRGFAVSRALGTRATNHGRGRELLTDAAIAIVRGLAG